jgi:hypothetical protein
VVIIHQDAHGRHVKTREISLRDKEFAKVKFFTTSIRTVFTVLRVFFTDFLEARQRRNRGSDAVTSSRALWGSLDYWPGINNLPQRTKLRHHRPTNH